MRQMMRHPLLMAALTLAVTIPGFAQTTRIAFEVSSIRELPSVRQLGGPSPSSLRVTETRMNFTGATLRSLIPMAFGVEESLIAWPAWLNVGWNDLRRFDIQATFPAGATRTQLPAMLQTLLAERFGLVVHVEPRPVPVYELVVAEGGIRMREVEAVNEIEKVFPMEAGDKVIGDSTSTPLVARSLVTDNRERIMATLRGGIRVVTASSLYESRLTERRTWQLDATRMGMADLASQLAGRTDRPVLDKTGLAGVYQFTVELPELASSGRVLQNLGITTNVRGEPLTVEPSGFSVFKAVETLGLRLEPRETPIDVLVIDRLEQTATEN